MHTALSSDVWTGVLLKPLGLKNDYDHLDRSGAGIFPSADFFKVEELTQGLDHYKKLRNNQDVAKCARSIS